MLLSSKLSSVNVRRLEGKHTVCSAVFIKCYFKDYLSVCDQRRSQMRAELRLQRHVRGLQRAYVLPFVETDTLGQSPMGL